MHSTLSSKQDNKKQAENSAKKVVKIGSKVKIHFFGSGREDTYEIVPYGGNLQNHTISMQSPLACAILGKEESDEVSFSVGNNQNKVKILKID